MLIDELVTLVAQHDTVIVQEDVPLADSAKLIADYNIGALPVVDEEDNIKGILSERDIVRAVSQHGSAFFEKTVKEAMTSSVITCSVNDNVEEIHALLGEKRIRHIPVAEEGKLVMLLSIRDFQRAYTMTLAH